MYNRYTGKPVRVSNYNPFVDGFDELKTARLFRNVYGFISPPEEFKKIASRIGLQEAIKKYYDEGYPVDLLNGPHLPPDIQLTLSVSEQITKTVMPGNMDSFAYFLSLRPPIMDYSIVHTFRYTVFLKDNSNVVRALIQHYEPRYWRHLMQKEVQFAVGKSGETDLFDMFIAHNVQPEISMLYGAIEGAHLDIIDRFFSFPIAKDSPLTHVHPDSYYDWYSVYRAAISLQDEKKEKMVDIMRRLFMHGANPNGTTGKTPAPIELAVVRGSVEAVKELLSYNVSLDGISPGLDCPLLTYAVRSKTSLSIIKLLVEAGADVNQVYNGKTALSMATEEDVRDYLFAHTDVSLRDL